MNEKEIFHQSLKFINELNYLQAEKLLKPISENFYNRLSIANNYCAVLMKQQKYDEVVNYLKDKNLYHPEIVFKYLICQGITKNKIKDILKIIFFVKKNKVFLDDGLVYISHLLERLKKNLLALKILKFAIKINSNNHYAKFNLSILNLKLKNFEEGWFDYDLRFEINKRYPYFLNQEKTLKNLNISPHKILLVWSEQGLGDIIQFSRLLRKMEQFFSKIYFVCPKLLQDMIDLNDKFIFLNTIDDVKNINFDYHIPLLGLLKILKITDKNILPSIIRKSSKSIKNSLPELSLINKKKFNIGITWSGSSLYPTNYFRSFKIEEYIKLLSLRKQWEIDFFCLQKDITDDEKVFLKNNNVENVGHLNLSDLRLFLNKLNLVISCDTSILHLAASLDVITYGLLSVESDWRWFLNDDKSNWYQSLKLFRQEKIFNWDSVFFDIKKNLIKNFDLINFKA